MVPSIQLLHHLFIRKTESLSHIFDGSFIYAFKRWIFPVNCFRLKLFQEMLFDSWKNLHGGRLSLFTDIFEPSLWEVTNSWWKGVRNELDILSMLRHKTTSWLWSFSVVEGAPSKLKLDIGLRGEDNCHISDINDKILERQHRIVVLILLPILDVFINSNIF